MANKTKSKLEVLWQDFEKTGSVESYLSYQAIKAASGKASKDKDENVGKVAAKSKR